MTMPDTTPTHETADADDAIGSWLSAALDDPTACDEFKEDILRWMDTRAARLASPSASGGTEVKG